LVLCQDLSLEVSGSEGLKGLKGSGGKKVDKPRGDLGDGVESGGLVKGRV
jgi:hypothetical protein